MPGLDGKGPIDNSGKARRKGQGALRGSNNGFCNNQEPMQQRQQNRAGLRLREGCRCNGLNVDNPRQTEGVGGGAARGSKAIGRRWGQNQGQKQNQ